ncbi:hypothetical protein GCM10023153_16770 [Ornithinibacter aureus]|uniref:Uncharacterized protein n=1 Tax=Ornithinibacter aureus TaxID=622664 RepID=A0ABP8JRP9_9MICO|nr:hypothetical protein C8E84_2181 [Ornithinibacter aureus]
MTVMPQTARPGEMSARSKAVVRKVGTTTVYVTKSRAVPVRLGGGKSLRGQDLLLGSTGMITRVTPSDESTVVKVRVKPAKRAKSRAKSTKS